MVGAADGPGNEAALGQEGQRSQRYNTGRDYKSKREITMLEPANNSGYVWKKIQSQTFR